MSTERETTREEGQAEQDNLIKEGWIKQTKGFRVSLDEILQDIKNSARKGRERSLCVTKIQEAIMWLGMDLKDLAAPNPYPNSYKPENAIVEPTADGLKL